MAKVGSEASNTEKMRQHQLIKYLQKQEYTSRQPVDLSREINGIDFVQSSILNCSPSFGSLENLFLSTDNVLVSDVDCQIIVKIFFKQPTNVFALTIDSQRPPDVANTSPPKTIQVYCDKPEFDFSEIDHTPRSDQTITADKNIIDKAMLRGSKFQRITNLILFIQENLENTDLTYLNNIIIWGYIH